MKKLISLLLVLCMMVPFAAMAEEAAPVKTGLYFSTDLTGSKDGQGYAYIAITGVAVDDNGVITACVIDMIQARINFDENGKLTTDQATEFQSKNELKDGYGMKGISPIGKEWYEQAAAFCTFITGKTLDEAIAIAVNPGETDVITSCTIGTEDFLKLIVKSGL